MARDFPALGFDPAPGDPAALNAHATRLRTAARTLADAHTALRTTRAQWWTGPGATEYRAGLDRLDLELAATTSAQTEAATVIAGFAERLADLQTTATALERRAAAGDRHAAGDAHRLADEHRTLTAGTATALDGALPRLRLDPIDDPLVHGFRLGPPAPPTITFDEDFPYDPSQPASMSDVIAYDKWLAKTYWGKLFRPGLDDALDAYEHYLGDSGADLEIDYAKAYEEDAGVPVIVGNEIYLAKRSVERLIATGAGTSFSITGPARPSTYAGEVVTENWQKTLGRYQQWASADVRVQGTTATMTITLHAEDRYNFNAGEADQATDIPDEVNGRFATVGLASSFRTYGSLTRTVTWELGSAYYRGDDIPPGRVRVDPHR